MTIDKKKLSIFAAPNFTLLSKEIKSINKNKNKN